MACASSGLNLVKALCECDIFDRYVFCVAQNMLSMLVGEQSVNV